MTIHFVYGAIVAIIFSYLAGSLSSAIIVCKLARLPDPRAQGSKNPGATNVLRIGGKKLAAIVLLGDALKGFIPVLVAGYVLSIPVASWCALAAFLGHLFPIFFGFKGGKGVATALGTWFALDWRLGLLAVLVWLIVAYMTRYSSLAAITMVLVVFASPLYSTPGYLTPVISIPLMCLILLWTHRHNIQRLLAGTEPKIGSEKK